MLIRFLINKTPIDTKAQNKPGSRVTRCRKVIIIELESAKSPCRVQVFCTDICLEAANSEMKKEMNIGQVADSH